MTKPHATPSRFGPPAWSSDVRHSAAAVLTQLSQGRLTLDALLEDIDRSGALKDPRDRDLLQALVFGALRWQGRLDFILAHCSKMPLHKIEPPVLAILRVALFQILYLTRIPASAAVHRAVENAKTIAGPWVAPFVNAVLRQAGREHSRLAFPDRRTKPLQALATEWSCPEWLVARWLERYGLEATAGLCAGINQLPPLTLRANTLKASREELMAAISPFATEVTPTAAAPDGITVSGLKTPLRDLPAFRHGWFQVQDEAAQLVTLLLNPQPGEAVLDGCAGRGGKTAHIAQLMQDRGRPVALDQSISRLSQLRDEMQRLGISVVAVCEADLLQSNACTGQELFDRILLDAPCSGLGTLRRNPDIKWSAHRRDLDRYHDLQLRMLQQVSSWLKPRGIMVYAVCSPEPEETVEVVQAFISNNPKFQVDREAGELPESIRALIDARGFLQTYPHLRYMDGFFAVRLTNKRR